MLDSVNVYWSCIENEWLRATEPESVSEIFYKNNRYDKDDPDFNMHFCPAFNAHMKNLYALKSMYSYSFRVTNNSVASDDYDQDFFNRHINIKSIKKKLFSYQQSFIFFTDEKSLPVTLSILPYLEDNSIVERCTVFPGELDIGKWFRNTDMAFLLKEKFNEFSIKEGDYFSYIKFHTDKKIKFKQFRFNEVLRGYLLDSVMSKNNKKRILTMEKYYSFFKTKKLLLKEIKKNLLE